MLPTMTSALLGLAGVLATAAGPGQELRAGGYEAYLARNPYNDRVLTAFVAELRSSGTLESWLEEQAGLAPLDQEQVEVLQARVLAAVGRSADAIAVLKSIPGWDPRRAGVLGRLYRKQGELQLAYEQLSSAVQGEVRGPHQERLLRVFAETCVGLSRHAEAERAYASLSAQQPQDLTLRLEVVELCGRAGLDAEAERQLDVARSLAAEDSEAMLRVLLAEAVQCLIVERPAGAERALREGLALLARDHWRRPELVRRLISLVRRSGGLGPWSQGLQQHLRDDAQDLAGFELLASVRLADGDPRGALAALELGLEARPTDERMLEQRLGLLRRVGADDERAAALLEHLERNPADEPSRFELALLLERDPTLAEAAQRQWSWLGARARGDAQALARLARVRSELGHHRAARAALQAALDVAPRDVALYAQLARLLAAYGPPEDLAQCLAEAARQLADEPAGLAEVASLQRALRGGEGARAALVLLAQAVECSDRSPRSVTELAQLLVVLGRPAAARELWRELIEGVQARHELERYVESYLASFGDGVARALAVSGEVQAARLAPHLRAPWRIALGGLLGAGESTRAYALAEEWLVERATDELVALEAARVFAACGDNLRAAELLRGLTLAGERSTEVRIECARLFARAQRAEAALDVVEELLQPGADQDPSLDQLARVLIEAGALARAAELLERSLVVEGELATRRLKLGSLYLAQGQRERGLIQLLMAFEAGRPAERAEVVEQLFRLPQDQVEFERLVRDLERRASSLSSAPALLAAELLVLEGRAADARALLDRLLVLAPREPLLLSRRAELCAALGEPAQSVRDLNLLLLLGAGEGVSARLVVTYLEAGQVSAAMELARGLESASEAAGLLRRHGRVEEALSLLEGAGEHAADGRADARLRADLLSQLGRTTEAVRAYETYLAQGGQESFVLRRLGQMCAQLGDHRRALELGRMLYGMMGPEGSEEYFLSVDAPGEWCALRCATLRADPLNASLVQETLDALTRVPAGADELLQLLCDLERSAREGGAAPAGHWAPAWSAQLHQREVRFLLANPGLRREYLSRARQSLRRGVADVRAAAGLARLGSGSAEDLGWMDSVRERMGDVPLLLLSMASQALLQERHAAGAELLEALARRLEGEHGRAFFAGRRREHRELQRAELLASLPAGVSELLAAQHLEQLVELSSARSALAQSSPAEWLDPARSRRSAAVAAALAGDATAARAALASLAPAADAGLAEWALYVSSQLSAGDTHGAALSLAPLIRAYRDLVRSSGAGAQLLSTVHPWDELARADDSPQTLALLYRELRGEAGLEPDWIMLGPRVRRAAVAGVFERECVQLGSDATGRPVEHAGQLARRIHRLRTLQVELLAINGDYGAALEAWDACERAHGEGTEHAPLRARLADRARDLEGALRSYRVALGRGLPEPSTAGGSLAATGSPELPVLEPEGPRGATWLFLERALAGQSRRAELELRLGLLRLCLEVGDVDGALGELESVCAGLTSPSATLLRNLRHAVSGYPLGERAADVFGALLRASPGDLPLLQETVVALWRAGRLGEAGRLLAGWSAGRELSHSERSRLERLRARQRELEAEAPLRER